MVHYPAFIDAFNLPVTHFYSNDWHADSWKMYTGQKFHDQWHCTFPIRMLNEIPAWCTNVTDKFRNTDYNQYLKPLTLQPHFVDNVTQFKYPLVPFCWFGAPYKWVGHSEAYEYRVNVAGESDMLKWCNVFKPSFPLRKDCYSVNNDLTMTSGKL